MTYVVTDEQVEALLATIRGLRCDAQPASSIRNHTIDTVDAALRLWVALIKNASYGHSFRVVGVRDAFAGEVIHRHAGEPQTVLQHSVIHCPPGPSRIMCGDIEENQ